MRVYARASRSVYASVRAIPSERGGKVEEKEEEDLRTSRGVVAERVAALRAWRRGETGEMPEIPRIARQWEEARRAASEREGDSLRAMSLAHDEEMSFSSS